MINDNIKEEIKKHLKDYLDEKGISTRKLFTCLNPEHNDLLDINVAKWYDPEKNDDTRHMGTAYYAAPEQAGFGMKASSPKSDIWTASHEFGGGAP